MSRASLLAAAVLVAAAATGCSAEPAPAPAPTASAPAAAAQPAAGLTAAPEGFAVALETTRETRDDGLVDWRAAWVLTWEPVPAAAGYVARFATSEGRGGRERELTEPELRVDAAAGTSAPGRLEQDQATQLVLTGSQLLVQVAATGPDGAPGPASAWYRVGDAPADGVPVPGSLPEH